MRSLPELAGIGVDRLNRVGPKHLEALQSVGVETVLDLLTYYPRRYIDRTNQAAISDLVEGQESMVLATVRKGTARRTRQGRTIAEVVLFDGSSYLRVTFFNQAWRLKQLSEGTQVVVFGKVERFRGQLRMTNPVVDLVGDRTGRIVPVYPQSEKAGLSSWEIGDWVSEALRRAGTFVDPLPESWRQRLSLPDRDWAMHHSTSCCASS